MTAAEPLVAIAFEATAIEWRGPAPFVFAAVPVALVERVRTAARVASYGWGCVPVHATANGVVFRTSLFPRDGGYLVPLKLAVRRAGAIVVGDLLTVELQIAACRLP